MHPYFIAALFTTPKTWRQPKRPLTNKDVVHLYNGILLSYKEKNEVMLFAANG